MEAPIAAVLGRLDALNLFDPYWMDPDYQLWYALLNCGIRMPASTGSDWFVCSSNRVYVSLQPGELFSYSAWLSGLAAGRTFVTNGPLLKLAVEQHSPSNDLLDVSSSVRRLQVTVEWGWHESLDATEIIRDGEVVATRSHDAGETHGVWTTTLDADGGWLAARAWGRQRTSYGHAPWAHTSPVYLRPLAQRDRVRASSRYFLERIDSATDWVAQHARFDHASQRERILTLFDEGRTAYAALLDR
jgi:hypothetical protein